LPPGKPNNTASLFNLQLQHPSVAKHILALSLVVSLLLLAGCTGTLANNGNGGNGDGNNTGNSTNSGNATVAQNGTALVAVLAVVSGCGIQPPDGDTSSCGVHSATPIQAKFNLSIYSINTKTMQPGLPAPVKASVQADANGEFSLALLPGDYLLELYDSRGNGESAQFAILPGKTTRVSVNFTVQVPGSRPY
jgi:hypothetical protein